MKNTLARPLMLTLLAALLPLSAQAHRSWLLPSTTMIDDKSGWVTVDAAVSEDLFYFDHLAQKLDGLEITAPDGKPLKPENVFSGRLRSSFDLNLTQVGTYRVSLIREGVTASYKLGSEVKRFRGTEQELNKQIPANATDVNITRTHARQETFLTVSQPGEIAPKQLSNVGIELVPLTHPNALLAGETARFRLVIDGKPLGNHLLGIVPGGVRYRGVLNEIAVTTDAQGEFSVKWPAAGMYWLNVSWPARSAGAPPAPTPRRAAYSATLEVLND